MHRRRTGGFGRDRPTWVVDRHCRMRRPFAERDRHDRACLGVLAGVREEVREDLREAVAVPLTLAARREPEIEVVLAMGRLGLGGGLPDELGEIDLRADERDAAAEPDA